jgi:hypothetical protein
MDTDDGLRPVHVRITISPTPNEGFHVEELRFHTQGETGQHGWPSLQNLPF